MALDIFTPIALIDQSSRLLVDVDTFTGKAGQFVELVGGKVKKVTTGSTIKNVRMLRTTVTGSAYEGFDIKGGRVSVIESFIRGTVGDDCIDATGLADGDYLTVSSAADSEGMMIKATAGKVVVAQLVTIDAAASTYEIRTVSPFIAA